MDYGLKLMTQPYFYIIQDKSVFKYCLPDTEPEGWMR